MGNLRDDSRILLKLGKCALDCGSRKLWNCEQFSSSQNVRLRMSLKLDTLFKSHTADCPISLKFGTAFDHVNINLTLPRFGHFGRERSARSLSSQSP